MTRIETPLAAPVTDKPAEKTIGKTASKDGDSRHAAFRSLLKQLGNPEKVASGTSDKETKTLPGDPAKRGLPSIRNRAESKDDKGKPAPEADAAAQAGEPSVGSEPVLAWQTILASSAADHQEQPATTIDLSALVSARAPDGDGPAVLPENKPHSTADHPSRSVGMALPTTAGLDLTRSDGTTSATTDTTDPFTALSSLLNRSTESATEPETVDLAPIKMTVVTRETHFEPVARLSPVQQIATAIGEELVTVAEPAPTDTASQVAEPSHHSSGPLKVLHIKLEPEDLGAVVLKMRLVDKSLELEVVASRQETADLLAKDRDTLTRVLRGSGYTADVIAITTSTAPDNGQMTGDNRAGAQPSSGQPGAQAGGNRGSNDSAGSGGRPSTRPQPIEGATHEESGAGRSGGDLYL
ncbi:flagellar hook-length control protein FliK [Pleomorphomonas oryzae]|uniref:flagellar hook-length control protein FliK n=1 Tax=Pleomorphomonas oryzae TaxID=261934 RepID=UPI00047931E4|nr:flagellar hook-length control protein FliK [Pleomorphomonas oryzae]